MIEICGKLDKLNTLLKLRCCDISFGVISSSRTPSVQNCFQSFSF